MSFRIWSTLGLGLLLFNFPACDDADTFDKGRADSGMASMDGGFNTPLALQTGWEFEYQATLSKRKDNREQSSIYTLKLKIIEVNDDGARSTITVVALWGTNDLQKDWDQTAGLDSWVALVGPANREDQVSTNPVVYDIEKPPTVPSKQPPKILPHPGIFFLDMRNIEDIRNAFNTLHADSSPSSQAPDINRAEWVLQLNGRDEDLITFSDKYKLRNMTLKYDARGFLTRIDERLGDNFDTLSPVGSYTLVLKSGPL